MRRIVLVMTLIVFRNGTVYSQTAGNDTLQHFHTAFPPLICFYAEALPYLYDNSDRSVPTLIIDTSEIVPVEKTYAGYMLYISNATEKDYSFRTSEDCLLLYAEVKSGTTWIPVSCIRAESCGSGPKSTAILPAGNTFELPVPVFYGSQLVELHYVLIWQSQKLVSNVIFMPIDPGQLHPENMPVHLFDQRLDPTYFLH